MRLLLTALLVVPGVASAGQFYKCETADGSTRYQDTPCAATENESQPDIVENAVDSAGDRRLLRNQQAQSRRDNAREAPSDLEASGPPGESDPPARQYFSYQCSVKSLTWYRHDDCPLSITVIDELDDTLVSMDPETGKFSYTRADLEIPREIPVKKRQVPRSLACKEILNPRSRNGAERDSEYSTYRRNQGKDPCSPKYLE